MVVVRLPSDEVFFAEWNAFRKSARRSLPRASQFAEAMNVSLSKVPSLVVVGSKGKATAVTYASAALHAAGKRVGTISSPPILSNRERIRVNGAAIGEGLYAEISHKVTRALRRLPPPTADGGFLAPAGMYLIAGLHFLHSLGCDVCVIEAGMGGRSDEVSLLTPTVVGITPVFGEHVGLLGANTVEIAQEKVDVIRPETRVVVSAPQTVEVAAVIHATRSDCVFVSADDCRPQFLPPGLSADNAAVGMMMARQYLPASRRLDDSALAPIMSTISLPGRLTVGNDAAGRRWLVDAAVNQTGVAKAFEYAVHEFGSVDAVLISVPNEKDVRRTTEWLDEIVGPDRWMPVIPPFSEHLHYSESSWQRPLVPWDHVSSRISSSRTVLAVGSWTFMSTVLSFLGLENERSFTLPCA